MTTIISGRFQEQLEADAAKEALIANGFPAGQIAIFYVNPPGQHDTYPIGGDRDKSPGAKQTEAGVVAGASAGAVVGAAVGAAGGLVAAPLGALVGGHVGGLIGALSSTKEKSEERGGDQPGFAATAPVRNAGMMVSVAVAEGEEEDTAIATFERLAAQNVERSNGTIVNGDWTDFDTLSPPNFVAGRGR